MFLCSVIVICISGCFASQEVPANTSPYTLSGETDGTCPTEEMLNAQRNANKEEIVQVLSDTVIPYLDESELMRNRCPCGGGGGGRWSRIAFLNMSDPDTQCPSNWNSTTSPFRACGRSSTNNACDSVTYPSNGQSYSRVCGRVNAYQGGFVDAFTPYLLDPVRTLEDTYFDGISLTHGGPGARQHIWSFAVALSELNPIDSIFVCSCTVVNVDWPYQVPSFVGDNYFCATGNRGIPSGEIFPDDPLFDGKGCGPTNACCTLNNPPWFCTTLPQPTTDDIELRICLDQDLQEDVYVSLVEIYVQ